MNKFMGIGRLTRDPDVRFSQGENPMCIAKYNLAIDRHMNNQTQTADFISCVAFGKNGEFAEKYLKQGMKIAVETHVQSGSFTNKDGQKVYTTSFVIDHQEFAESKAANESYAASQPNRNEEGGFLNSPDGVEDEGLPFN